MRYIKRIGEISKRRTCFCEKAYMLFGKGVHAI